MSKTTGNNRRGAVLVIFAVCIAALLCIIALVIDLGRLYAAKQRAQTVADSAALAGAWLLDGTAESQSDAGNTAQQFALANNDKVGANWKVFKISGGEGVDVSFPTTVTKADGTTVTVGPGSSIQTDGKVNVDYTFAGFMGFLSGTASAKAIAIRTAAENLTARMVPWCVSDTSIWNNGDPNAGLRQPLGTPMTLKITNPKNEASFIGPGNFLCVAYDGDSGSSVYRDRVNGEDKNGNLPSLVNLGTGGTIDVSTEPGNMIGPTTQGLLGGAGLEGRLNMDPKYTYDQWVQTYDPDTNTCADTPRIVIVPIIDDPGGDLSGRKDLQCVGFAAFFIESFDKKTGNVTGRFITGQSNGTEIRWMPGNFPMGTTNLITTIRLVR